MIIINEIITNLSLCMRKIYALSHYIQQHVKTSTSVKKYFLQGSKSTPVIWNKPLGILKNHNQNEM